MAYHEMPIIWYTVYHIYIYIIDYVHRLYHRYWNILEYFVVHPISFGCHMEVSYGGVLSSQRAAGAQKESKNVLQKLQDRLDRYLLVSTKWDKWIHIVVFYWIFWDIHGV